MSKRRRAVKRNRRLLIIVSLAALIIVAGICTRKLTAFAAEQPGSVVYSSVCIRQGDTLWSIAREHCGSSDAATIAAYVEKLARINGISSRRTIYPGDYLMVERTISTNE